ncbi:heavy-metal-associated domain-containing protein [Arthrobacter sp. TMS1-12-1]
MADFALTGLTCGSCASRVSGAVTALEGVRDVRIDLVPGGTSTLSVISAEPVNSSAIASAVEKAGYRLLAS